MTTIQSSCTGSHILFYSGWYFKDSTSLPILFSSIMAKTLQNSPFPAALQAPALYLALDTCKA